MNGNVLVNIMEPCLVGFWFLLDFWLSLSQSAFRPILPLLGVIFLKFFIQPSDIVLLIEIVQFFFIGFANASVRVNQPDQLYFGI